MLDAVGWHNQGVGLQFAAIRGSGGLLPLRDAVRVVVVGGGGRLLAGSA